LGKLGDLRAPKAISSMAGGSAVWAKFQSKVAETGGRWTAVVSRPGSGSSSPAPGASSSSGGTQVGAATLSLKPSSGAWVSSSVQRAREAASLEMGGEEEAVPDDWRMICGQVQGLDSYQGLSREYIYEPMSPGVACATMLPTYVQAKAVDGVHQRQPT
ncbi:hypothetical protein BDR07DRAFT_1438273, partial [Suillus spraguei]